MAHDAKLLRQFVAGSEPAFAELVERHLALVYSSALRRSRGDAALAQDVTQAVFILLAKKSRHLCQHPSLAGWLYATAQFKVAEAVRAEQRRRIREHAAHLMHQMSTDTQAPNWEQIRPILDEAMLELKGSDREAVLLRYFEGLPFAEIASRLLLNESVAHKRVERALEKLRQRLACNGVTSSASALAAALGSHTGVAAPAGMAKAVTNAAAATIVTGADSGLINFIALMTTTQKTIAVAAIVALSATGGVLYQRQTARRLISERTLYERQLTAVRQNLHAPADAAAIAPRAAVSTPALQSVSVAASKAQSLVSAIEAEQMRLFFATEWAKLAGGALPLMEKLGLSTEQIARYTAMAEREPDGTYLPGPGALNRHLTELRERWETETRELIGEDPFKRLQQLQSAQAAVQRVASYLAYWDNAFTGQQANQMLQLFAANETILQAAGGTLAASLISPAKQILSADQITLWRRYDGLAEIQRQLSEHFRREEVSAASKPSGG